MPNPGPNERPMTQPEPTRGAEGISGAHRPQSMSDAVEVAAGEIWRRTYGSGSGRWDQGEGDPDDRRECLRIAHAALSAIGLPELLAEVERLRGVASAAREITTMPYDLIAAVILDHTSVPRQKFLALAAAIAALASEDKT